MDFGQLVKTRQSVRDYLPDPVEKEQIEKCLEAARLAPSACNSQPWKFVIIDDPELKNEVASMTCGKILPLNHFTRQVPVIVAIVTEKQKIAAKMANTLKNKPLEAMDIAIAAEHFCLQAAELNLGTCMLGWFDEKAIKKALHVPKTKRIYLLITLGHPKSEHIRPKTRKTANEISSYNNYNNKK
jgi:nitroreductase